MVRPLHVYDSGSANRKQPGRDTGFDLLPILATQSQEGLLHRVLCSLPITPEHSACVRQQWPLVAVYESVDGLRRPG